VGAKELGQPAEVRPWWSQWRAGFNKNVWSSGSNEASLSGAGLGLNWQGPKGVSARIFIASSVGELPSQLSGSESTHTNAWTELGWAF
jgi:hypothetical protein